MGIAVNSEGTIALTDYNGSCVYIFANQGTCLRKIGCPGGSLGQFNRPIDVLFVNDKEILVSDEFNQRIQQFSIETGTFVKTFGKPGTGKGELSHPVGICMDDEGHIVVTEFNNQRIQVMSKGGENIFTFGESGPGKLDHPLSCIRLKDKFFVSDSDNHCIKVFDKAGQFLYKFGSHGNADGQLNRPFGLHVDKFDCLLVCDQYNDRVQKFSLEGRFIGKSTPQLPNVNRVVKMPDGRILVTSCNDRKVHILRS